jgi:hypothetical protein
MELDKILQQFAVGFLLTEMYENMHLENQIGFTDGAQYYVFGLAMCHRVTRPAAFGALVAEVYHHYQRPYRNNKFNIF